MPIPQFSIDGVLPPFVGPDGPGGRAEDLTPYAVTALEVVSTLGSSPNRRQILRGWLDHRKGLRAVGFERGFQWLDGSFVEAKEPQDLDVVSFLQRPKGHEGLAEFARLFADNGELFSRRSVKHTYKLDVFFIDLSLEAEDIVNPTRYFLGLFSHRRNDRLWKGMLQVRIEGQADDDAALTILDAADASLPATMAVAAAAPNAGAMP